MISSSLFCFVFGIYQGRVIYTHWSCLTRSVLTLVWLCVEIERLSSHDCWLLCVFMSSCTRTCAVCAGRFRPSWWASNVEAHVAHYRIASNTTGMFGTVPVLSVPLWMSYRTYLSPCHTITQPTRWITTTNPGRTNTRHLNTRNTRHSNGSNHNQYPSLFFYLPADG